MHIKVLYFSVIYSWPLAPYISTLLLTYLLTLTVSIYIAITKHWVFTVITKIFGELGGQNLGACAPSPGGMCPQPQHRTVPAHGGTFMVDIPCNNFVEIRSIVFKL